MITAARTDDLAPVLALLRASSLPEAGVEEHLGGFLVARDEEGRLVGCVGLEAYGDVGLLRSLAVHGDRRGSGTGAALVDALFELARARGVATMYLLTTTAESYFPRFGFDIVPRDNADPRLDASEELRGACPASAVLMRRRL